jgi:STE24 endopeptidase
MHSFSLLFLMAVAASVGIEWWLARRQARFILARRDRVPPAFAARIPPSRHRLAADYTVAKVRLSVAAGAWGAAIVLAWTLGGGIDLVDTLWRGLSLGPIASGVGVLVTVGLVGSLLHLPFELYRTFGIEQRFGFNRTTPRLFVLDKVKGLLLGLALGLPMAWIALALMHASGGLWWLWVWTVWMGLSLLLVWLYPILIAPLFNRFTPLDDKALRARIETLLERCGFTSKGVFVMDGSRRSAHGNAYFTGFGANKRIVFFDTLIEALSAPEIEAVLAHELGHYRLHHVRTRLIVSAVASLTGLGLLGWLATQHWFYAGLGVDQPSHHAALALFAIAGPVFGFFLTPIGAAFSRRHEFQADDYATAQSSPRALADALIKLYRDNASTLTPDPLYSAFFDSHPPAPLRVARLAPDLT